jgi:beta-galactosidase
LAVREPDGYCGKINMTAWSVWPTWESWNWPGWEGKPIEVEVYTKAPEVKLYLNDKLIGTKAVSEETEYKAVFTVNYEPGTLRAEVTTPLSTREGLGVSLQTSGEPAQLRLTADKPAFKADGQDLVFITVEVVDAQGRVCPDAAIPCEATVQGQGRLMAFATADLTDREPKTSSHVTTWKGRALLVVRSNKNKGKATVSIKSSLPKANLTIKSK